MIWVVVLVVLAAVALGLLLRGLAGLDKPWEDDDVRS